MTKRRKSSFLRLRHAIALIALALFAVGYYVNDAELAPAALEPPPSLWSNLSQAVVMLSNEGRTTGGTGFVVTAPNGRVVTVTNWHVCSIDLKELHAYRAGEFTDVVLKVLAYEAKHDLCLLDAAPGKPIQLNGSVSRFSSVYILGHPALKSQTPSIGVYLGEDKVTIPFPKPNYGVGPCPEGFTEETNGFVAVCLNEMTLADTTAVIFPGSSGSPVVDSTGRLVGVINSGSRATNYGSYVPARFLNKLFEKLP